MKRASSSVRLDPISIMPPRLDRTNQWQTIQRWGRLCLQGAETTMKILIMGAGAVGAYYGAQLQRAGEEVVFCARGDNLRALREHGLEITSFKGDLELAVDTTGDPQEFAPYELILFA